MDSVNLRTQVHKPLNSLMPSVIELIEKNVSQYLTTIIINYVSGQLSPIMERVNLRGMIEQQINTFDLDYIERLIIEIANKELKLIMLLGFLLGGIIGCLQGIIAIFV